MKQKWKYEVERVCLICFYTPLCILLFNTCVLDILLVSLKRHRNLITNTCPIKRLKKLVSKISILVMIHYFEYMHRSTSCSCVTIYMLIVRKVVSILNASNFNNVDFYHLAKWLDVCHYPTSCHSIKVVFDFKTKTYQPNRR